MNELQMCKAFAKLDGLSEFLMHRGEMYIADLKGELSVTCCDRGYAPDFELGKSQKCSNKF